MTKLVRAGSAEGTSQYLLAQLRQAIINKNPEAAAKWSGATKVADTLHDGLGSSGAPETRSTGGFDASPEDGVTPEDIHYIRPDAGTNAEGDLNLAMDRIDEIQRDADIKIRDGLISGALIPLAIDGAQIFEIAEHNWRAEIAAADSNDRYVHPGYINFDGERRSIYFDRGEADRFVAGLLNLPTFEDLPPKQQEIVRFLRKHCPTRDYGKFGTNKQMIQAILIECPPLKSIDDNTYRKARAFFEAESKGRPAASA